MAAGRIADAWSSSAASAAESQQESRTEHSPPASEKCDRRLPPIGLYGAANDLLEAAYYAQWVLEDISCKYPEDEEVKKALFKLKLAISKAEGR